MVLSLAVCPLSEALQVDVFERTYAFAGHNERVAIFDVLFILQADSADFFSVFIVGRPFIVFSESEPRGWRTGSASRPCLF